MNHATRLALCLSLAACSDGGSEPADTSTDSGDAAFDLGDSGLAPDAVDLDTDTAADTDADIAADPDVDPDPDGAQDTDVDAEDAGPTPCDPNTGNALSFGVGDWTIEVTADGSWSVIPPEAEEPTLYAPPTCVDGAATLRVANGTPQVLNEFGAFRVRLDTRESRLEWSEVTGSPTAAEGALTYQIVGGGEVVLNFTESGGDLRVELTGDWDAGELIWALGGEDSYFGLGTQATGMDLVGRTFPLWTQEQGNGKPEDPVAWPLQGEPEAAYAPMGVWHSSAGFSAVITHDAYSEIDLGKSDASQVALRSYAALPGFVLVEGTSPRARLEAITEYTGRLPEDPPDWTFAPWNDAVGGGERIREVATILRDNDIPSSAIWSEDWIGGEQTGTGYRLSYAWEWSDETYPNLPEDIAWLHANGFAFLAYFNTFVPQPTRMWTEGVDGNFLMTKADGSVRTVVDPAFRTAGLVNLNDDAATAWMQSYMETAAELGVDGWMADFTEWAPIDVEFEDGTDPWHFHNRYPIRFQETVRAAMEAVHDGSDGEATNNWTYFARSGWASVNGGSGGVTPTLWGGDQNTNWEYDDGFPTVVPIAAHVGMSGVPIFGSDVAGYNALFGTPTTKELFYRWSAMAAFQGLMRTHHGSNECANWAFDRDLETLEHYRRYAVIHSLLYPVFRSLATEARETGLPLVRHPYLVAPEARWMWQGDQYQFFLGDDLLVAPVLEQGATSREVAVPATGWWPLFGDGPVEAETGGDGSRSVSVDAPATELPVLVRPGTALPLLGEPVDSFYGASEEGVSDLDAVDRYRLVLYPDVDGNVRDADVGGVAATLASGWNTVDWGAPTLDGEALPTCEGASATSCVDGVRALLVGGGLFVAGGATIELTAEVDDVGVWIGVGGAGWVPWDAETTLTDINPDIPPPCEEGE